MKAGASRCPGGCIDAVPSAGSLVKREMLLGGVVMALLAVSTADGANYAKDNAADPAYNTGWTAGSGGGSGWGSAWMMGGIEGTAFIGSSARDGASIDTQGRAFAMKLTGGANGNAPGIVAQRLFSGDPKLFNELSPGQTVKIDMENGTLAPGEHLGWGIYGFILPGTSANFQFFADTNPNITHGKPDYFVFDNTGYHDTGVPITDQGVHCDFAILDAHSDDVLTQDYALSITPLPTGAPTTTVYGTTLVGGPNNMLVLTDSNGDSSAPADTAAQYLYFNNIAVVPSVPEPSSLMLFSVAALPLLGRCRRERSAPDR